MFLLVLLLRWPTGGILSRYGGTVCARTGDIMGTTIYSPFSENDPVLRGNTALVRLCVPHGWALRKGIPIFLYHFFLRPGLPWCPLPRRTPFIWVGIPAVIDSRCPNLGMYWYLPGVRLLSIFRARKGRLYWVSLWFEDHKIWCGLPGLPSFGNVLPKWGTLWWVWWGHQWICILKTLDPQFTLSMCILELMKYIQVGITTWRVSACVGTGVLTHTMTCTRGGNLQGLFLIF